MHYYYEPPTYLSAADAAARLGLSLDELHALTIEAGRPSFVTGPDGIRYDESDVVRMLREAQS